MGAMDLAGLVRVLHAIDPAQYGPDNVGRLLSEVSFGVDGVKPYVSFRQGRYTRNLVFRNDDFELAVLCWDAGSSSPVHDHAAQRCWLAALEGTFDVENYARAVGGFAPGHARLNRLDTVYGLRRGQPDYRYGDNDVHRVAVSPSQSGAVSLHVYAKPLTSCLVYDYEGQRCSRQPLDYDTIATDRITQLLTI